MSNRDGRVMVSFRETITGEMYFLACFMPFYDLVCRGCVQLLQSIFSPWCNSKCCRVLRHLAVMAESWRVFTVVRQIKHLSPVFDMWRERKIHIHVTSLHWFKKIAKANGSVLWAPAAVESTAAVCVDYSNKWHATWCSCSRMKVPKCGTPPALTLFIAIISEGQHILRGMTALIIKELNSLHLRF